MTTFINKWFKQIFIHYALTDVDLQKSSSNQTYYKDKNLVNDRCTIVDKPSTMSDVDAMYHNEKQNENFLIENQELKKDTIVIDKFQTCFIDCTCQCEARKIIPQMNINQCPSTKKQLFEELIQHMHGPSYEINCSCNCGKNGMRTLKFNYATSDKNTNNY
ncbi:unnamed protein product [Adineta steineri]|uniref:Uncharacterized protein n=1 Tax=Adineta steineri TaxID=433720 RepID=A0A813TJM1_9BILA|nr:unnamed protein product [Adineta steineri]CAF3489551.1 unnamed protein product [Adineta steineri]